MKLSALALVFVALNAAGARAAVLATIATFNSTNGAEPYGG